MKKGNFSKLLSSLLLLNTTVSYGFEFNPEIVFSGFASTGVSVTNATNVNFVEPIFKQTFSSVPTIVGIGNEPNFQQDTVGGLQFNANVNQYLSFNAQFVSEGMKDYAVETDWLYVGFHINDEWDIQLGRVIIPLLMHYPYLKVNYAYVWSRLPLEVYSLGISNFEGLLIRNTRPLYKDWSTKLTVSYGTSSGFNQFYEPPLRFEETKGVFTELLLYNNNYRFRIAYDQLTLSLNPDGLNAYLGVLQNPCGTFSSLLSPSEITLDSGPTPGTCQITAINSPFPFSPTQGLVQPDFEVAKLLTLKNLKTELLSAGYEVKWNHFISIAEIFNTFISDKYATGVQSWYAMVGYNWYDITPNITFSKYRSTNNSSRKIYNTAAANYVNPFSYFGPLPIPSPETFETSVNQFLALNNNAQQTIDVGVRYDIGTSTSLKFDYRYVMVQNNTHGFFSVDPNKRISWITAVIATVF